MTMMIVGLIMGLLQMEYVRVNYDIPAQGQKITLYLFEAGLILFCLSPRVESLFKKNFVTCIILYIGEISLGIYFTHVYLIWIVERLFPQIRESWLIMWLFSILLTIGLVIAVKRVSPSFAKKYLGYR